MIYMHVFKVKHKEEKILHAQASEDRRDFQAQLHTEIAANETLEQNPIRLRTIDAPDGTRVKSKICWNESRGNDTGYNSTNTTLDHQIRFKDRLVFFNS